MNAHKGMIRRFILYNHKYIESAMISPRQLSILGYMKNMRWITSREVAIKYKTSVQSASTQLKRLLELGYIRRFDHGAVTGGKEYGYELEPDLLKEEQ